jgi:hypothetical protein
MPRRPPRNVKLAATLRERAKGRLLCDLFDAISVDDQCSLIARTLEPHIGGLALLRVGAMVARDALHRGVEQSGSSSLIT